jgi:hypothetical protein
MASAARRQAPSDADNPGQADPTEALLVIALRRHLQRNRPLSHFNDSRAAPAYNRGRHPTGTHS